MQLAGKSKHEAPGRGHLPVVEEEIWRRKKVNSVDGECVNQVVDTF